MSNTRPTRSSTRHVKDIPNDSSSRWADSHGTGNRQEIGVWGLGGILGNLLYSAGALALMLFTPMISVYMWHINEYCNGSLFEFFRRIWQTTESSYLLDTFPQPSRLAVSYLAAFGAIQACLQLLMPGKQYLGPHTPKGNVPVYKANGLQCYLATLALFFFSWHMDWFDPALVYDHMGEILSTSNVASLILCLILYVKGRFAPSSSDNGSTGSFMMDYYWGRELFPRIGASFDIKTWTNCRMGMMSWGVLPLCYAVKQYSLATNASIAGAHDDIIPGLSNAMLVSVVLMEVYVAKFFLWETGYWSSMDITHDRAGFYLCWGCLVWVPAIYTSPAMFMVRHPPGHLSAAGAMCLLAAGLAMVGVNYDSDRQRQEFRKNEGKEKIWGKAPVKIQAKYTTGDGKVKTSLLLASGWWGLSRHFHYLPEMLAAFFWSAPAGFNSFLPFFYLFFLIGLLTDRAFRDEERCASKYGRYYDEYRKKVPYKIIPYVF
jgi:7-dehydrocholesterol reductase